MFYFNPIPFYAGMARMAGQMMECQMRLGLTATHAIWGTPNVKVRSPGTRGPVTRPNETDKRVVSAARPVVVGASPKGAAPAYTGRRSAPDGISHAPGAT